MLSAARANPSTFLLLIAINPRIQPQGRHKLQPPSSFAARAASDRNYLAARFGSMISVIRVCLAALASSPDVSLRKPK
jgi:hypothetical protein